MLAFWKTWPRPGMSISFPAASQHRDVFNRLNEMCRCLLVRKDTSPALHLEKIPIVFQHIVKSWKASWMILVCFSEQMNSSGRKFKVGLCYSSFGQCLAGMHCYNWKHGQTKTDGGDNTLNLQPQRRECKGWSRIELRILDSRRLQKASVRGEKSHHCRCSSTISASSHQEAAQTCCRDSQKSVNWQRGSSNHGCQALVLLLRPSSTSSLLSLLRVLAVSQPKLLLSHGDSFQRFFFCLMKKLQDTDAHLWKRLISGTIILSLVLKHKKNRMVWFINSIFGNVQLSRWG